MPLRLTLFRVLPHNHPITHCYVNFADDSRIQKFVLQLLVNMTASSPNCLDLVWTKVFPNRLATAASASQGKLAV